MQLRGIECEVCGQEVVLPRKRFLALLESGRKPLCEQCRRYVQPVTARVSQPSQMSDVMTQITRRKIGRLAKRARVLANLPLGRCGVLGYGDGEEVTE